MVARNLGADVPAFLANIRHAVGRPLFEDHVAELGRIPVKMRIVNRPAVPAGWRLCGKHIRGPRESGSAGSGDYAQESSTIEWHRAAQSVPLVTENVLYAQTPATVPAPIQIAALAALLSRRSPPD